MNIKCKKLLSVISFTFICGNAFAQFSQTDEFDYWEDQSSHNYAVTGVNFRGAYICGIDSTLRIGNCSSGMGSVSVDVAVKPNCDSVELAFQFAWGNHFVLYVDGVRDTVIIPVASCAFHTVLIPNASVYSADGIITVMLEDTISACTGDFQVARLQVFSTKSFSTGTSFYSDENNVKLEIFPNPNSGSFSLSVKSKSQETFQLAVYNAEGKMIIQKKISVDAGANNISLALPEAGNGFYFLEMISEENKFFRKIQVAR